MDESKIKSVVEDLISTFLMAGELSIKLRDKGLNKEIKSDNTPVSNGDLEVNKIITKKLLELTPNIPIVSEETSHNKSKTNLKNFWLVDPIDGTYDYINNLDINLICEQPKVSKYRDKIIKSLSNLLNIDKELINLKGKTVEKLGLIGKEEAIASEVICSITQ